MHNIWFYVSAETVQELRIFFFFLERDIGVLIVIRNILVKLAEVALELQLPVIFEEDDCKITNLKWRTIRSLAGDEIVCQDITTIISRFTKDLKERLCLEICDVDIVDIFADVFRLIR